MQHCHYRSSASNLSMASLLKGWAGGKVVESLGRHKRDRTTYVTQEEGNLGSLTGRRTHHLHSTDLFRVSSPGLPPV